MNGASIRKGKIGLLAILTLLLTVLATGWGCSDPSGDPIPGSDLERGLALYEAGDLAGCIVAMTTAAADPSVAPITILASTRVAIITAAIYLPVPRAAKQDHRRPRPST